LIAGFLAGNHFHFFPSVTDIKSVEVWAEIGVIVLLFSLGLEFSFKAHESGRNRLYYRSHTDYCHGLNGVSSRYMDGLETNGFHFPGVILSVSSTTIILKPLTSWV
jgi:CPA2 family monovalent cation:H+ antiporter-2